MRWYSHVVIVLCEALLGRSRARSRRKSRAVKCLLHCVGHSARVLAARQQARLRAPPPFQRKLLVRHCCLRAPGLRLSALEERGYGLGHVDSRIVKHGFLHAVGRDLR